jgi:hypothetical protein
MSAPPIPVPAAPAAPTAPPRLGRRHRLALTVLVLALPVAVWAALLATWPGRVQTLRQESASLSAQRYITQGATASQAASAFRRYRDTEAQGPVYAIAGVALVVAAGCVYSLTALVPVAGRRAWGA